MYSKNSSHTPAWHMLKGKPDPTRARVEQHVHGINIEI